jgi:hypothetical protein
MTVSILLSIKIGGRKLIIERKSPPSHITAIASTYSFLCWLASSYSSLQCPSFDTVIIYRELDNYWKTGWRARSQMEGVKHCLRVIKDKKKGKKSFYFWRKSIRCVQGPVSAPKGYFLISSWVSAVCSLPWLYFLGGEPFRLTPACYSPRHQVVRFKIKKRGKLQSHESGKRKIQK